MTSLTIPATANTEAAVAHLVDHSGLAHTVLIGWDTGQRVARLQVPPELLSSGQQPLWRWAGELCGVRSGLTIFDVLTDPFVDAASRAAVLGSVSVWFSGQAVAA